MVDEPELPPGPPWAAPEIAAAGILAAVGVLALGGLATGIDVAVGRGQPFGDSLQQLWLAVQTGALWAGPVLAILLLGVVGLCWWQADRWLDDADEAGPGHAEAYIGRAQLLATWAVAGLAVTLLGALAEVAAVIGIDIPSHAGSLEWSRLITVAAGALAVAVVCVAGLLVLRALRDGHRQI